MDPFGVKAVATASVICTLMAVRAVKRKSLTVQGGVAGFITGFLLVCTGLRGIVLFFFYQLGSWATKYKAGVKGQRDASVETHSSRGATQVLCVSAIAVGLSLWHALYYGAERPIDFTLYPQESKFACAIVAHHATGLADTLASELGILSKQHPVLITQPWKAVPPECNGGVTFLGFGWSLLGGAIIGLLTLLMDLISSLHPGKYALRLVLYAAMAGLLGSVIDSVFGAVLQATLWDGSRVFHFEIASEKAKHLTGCNILSNEQVNLVSTALTCAIAGWGLAPFMLAT